jgi:hypothetical protein
VPVLRCTNASDVSAALSPACIDSNGVLDSVETGPPAVLNVWWMAMDETPARWKANVSWKPRHALSAVNVPALKRIQLRDSVQHDEAGSIRSIS